MITKARATQEKEVKANHRRARASSAEDGTGGQTVRTDIGAKKADNNGRPKERGRTSGPKERELKKEKADG